jgi:hypothetical protein
MNTHTTALEQLKLAEDRARAAYWEAKRAVDVAKSKQLRQAQMEIEDRFLLQYGTLAPLRKQFQDAVSALEDEKIRMALSGEDGKLPVGTRVRRKDYGGYGTKPTFIYGVIEVRTRQTEFPQNLADYSIPSLGSRFVRICKADGTPGKRIARYALDWERADGNTQQ